MQNKNLEKILLNCGLNEKQSKVYLAGLSLGSSSIQQIAKQAELKRTTVYSIIDSLVEAGLFTIEVKGFKKRYLAESPASIEKLIEQRRRDFHSSLPELMALYNLKGDEGFIKYYQGLSAVKNIYEDLIKDVKPKDDYLIIGYIDKFLKQDPEYFEDFLLRRAKLNINIRMLAVESKLASKRQKLNHIYKDNIKILPKKTKISTNSVIIPKRLVIHQIVPPIFAIVIENQSIVKLHKEMFEIIWDSIL